ncbi:MAG: thiol-disulfide oxidoreductase DCC family protein [Bacteriovoracaceae bacterium]
MEEKSKYQLPLLLFDGQCELCRRFKQSLERLPGTESIQMVSIHDKEVYDKYEQINFDDCSKTVHYLDTEGKVYRGEEVITHLIEKFPLVRRFSWLIQSDMGQKASKYFYDKVNQYREELLKRCGNCK